MKVNPKFLMMMAALAAGSATAATTSTTAGTIITNVASATYDDPISGTPVTPFNSNTVQTTVLPLPDFDIRFQNNTPTDGGTQNALNTTTKVVLNAVPGQAVETLYTAINLGNTPLTIGLSVNQVGAGGQSVAYFPAGTTDFVNTPSTAQIVVQADDPNTPIDEGVTNFIQRIVIPPTATRTDVFGATPIGRVTGTGTTLAADGTVTGNGYATGSINEEENKALGTDWQFVAITMFASTLDNKPNPSTPPTNPVDPGGNPYTPTPASGPVNVPTLPVGPDATPNTPPVNPSSPGYMDGTTPIIPNATGDTQIAYPAADPDNLADFVTFTNALTNTSAQGDALQLFPSGAVATNGTLNAGWTFDAATGTFTQNAGNPLTEIRVTFLNPNGTPVTVKTGATYPTLIVPANSSAYYLTRITYPDPDDSAPVLSRSVTTDVDSINDAGFAPETGGSTTNTIMPAAAQFGDATAPLGAVPTPATNQTVRPNGTFGGVSSPDVTDATAIFPMDVVNNGTYNDTYILSAGTAVPGTTVRYFYADGTELGTITSGPNTGKYVTTVVAAGSELKVFARIDVPTSTSTGVYAVSQNATGYFSTIPMSDTNNTVTVSPVGAVGVAKFTERTPTTAGSETVATPSGVSFPNPVNFTAQPNTGALPGQDITYRIIAKNTFNTSVARFFIRDTVPANTTFVSVSIVGVVASKTIYSVDGGNTWSATAPGVTATTVAVAIDNNNDLIPDALASGAEVSANFVVKVK
ncbi:hypothetical protein GCM10010840_33590 [Deinococcus aerolatus]|uniref:DUF11 domain-containing protein n=1 Tax=Deinococcus aerolatus TaxID=522487 RepID=A0ABQ2GFM9_9DEIO|nr:hypothetical protein [Deinococcus aerolatus]GGL92781.1 hypothetical protein GCM10010840_33590 [Deinococcus aerolatus]